jgi:hypothetical protein
MLMGGGPKVMAAKAIAMECLPAVTSASLGAIMARVIWNRLPKWIREDVSFRNSKFYGAMSSSTAPRTTDIERLSSVLEKIHAWIQECTKRLKDPIPHLYASFFIYWQLMSQHQKIVVDLSLVNISPRDNRPKEQNPSPNKEHEINYEMLHDMLHLATSAYYIHDADELAKMLDVLNYEAKTCVLPSRPGSVGYYVAFPKQFKTPEESTGVNSVSKTMIIGVRGTSTLEEVLTDACGRSVSFQSPESVGDESGEGISNSIRVEVRAKDDDVVYISSAVEQNREETNDIEIVSGHERIYVEQDVEDVEDFTFSDKGRSLKNGSRVFLKKSSSLDSQIRCHEGILASAKRLFYQVRGIVEEHVIHGDCCQLIITGHSLGASAGCLLALMLRSRYPELVMTNRVHVYAFGPPPVLDYDSAIGASTYVTSIVNQSDIIPRCSLVNLEIFLEVLRQVSLDILISKDIAPTNIQNTSALLQQLSNDKAGSLCSIDELSTAIQTALSVVEIRSPNNLYVPGKLLYISCDESQSKKHLEDGCKQYSCHVTDGASASLRVVTMNGYQMLGDHTTAAYFTTIESFLPKKDNN